MEIDNDVLAIQAAHSRIIIQLVLSLSEAKLLHPERAEQCAEDIKRVADVLDRNRFEAFGPDVPPQEQAGLFQAIAQLLDNRAADSSSYRPRP